MQFPNPIIRSLILYDNSGNAVIVLGPGPFIKIINPTSGAELDLDAGTTFPEAVFWNTAHTDFGKISLEVSPFSANQMMLIRSPAEPSPILPGNPLIQMRMFMTSFLQLGDVKPPNTNDGIGGQLVLDEGSWSLSRRDNATQSDVVYIRHIQNDEIEIACETSAGLVIIAQNDPFSHKGIVYDASDQELKAWDSGVLDWTNLTITGGWSASAGYYTPQYRFTPDGLIELRGNMTAGTTADATAVITMPVVPAKFGLIRPALEAGGTVNARLFYNTDGKIYVFGCAGATKMSLDGMRFNYK